MNSEELELSLRTEFEAYLNSALTEMKQEVAEFQKRIDAEFDRHRSQISDAFRAFSERFEASATLDEGFKGSVTEHLRLARDEGAKIAANAFAEAEDMVKGESSLSGADKIRDAVREISSKQTQSAILNALIDHCEHFAPRGAFFIVKNEAFRGWRVLGSSMAFDDESARDLQFPVSSDTVLAKAVRSLNSVEAHAADNADNNEFLDPLKFGKPSRMFAVPLVARGRGVAVLYADGGEESAAVNLDALETLVRVASLTVELLASAQSARPIQREAMQPAGISSDAFAVQEAAPEAFESAAAEAVDSEPEFESFAAAEPAADEFSTVAYTADEFPVSFAEEQVETAEPEVEFVTEPETAAAEFAEPAVEESFSWNGAVEPAESEPVSFEATEYTFETNGAEPEVRQVSEFDAVDESSFGQVEESAEPAVAFEPAAEVESVVEEAKPEPAVEVVTLPEPGVTRLRDRHVDLPIEVAEDERRFHNDARRFARLLVSEIKLYNEQQVKEGREGRNLYERLREAIDRSRDMYNKRVQPPVASKFDYFHYELVSTLAEGDENRLGGGYPGASI